MAHKTQQDYCKKIKFLYPQYFINVNVLDAGSLNINGNNRSYFQNCNYTGLDLGNGENVNVISKIHEYSSSIQYDTIISTETFEHDLYWVRSIMNIIDLLKPGGLFLFTCGTTNRKEHGTINTDTYSSPFTTKIDKWKNYYKNLTENDIRSNINLKFYFSEYKFEVNTESADLYFYGIKKELGGWSIKKELIDYIKTILPANNIILELGSGSGTIELCKTFKVYSIEHDKEWLNFYKTSNYIYAPIRNYEAYQYAPIKNYESYKWYDVANIKKNLPSKYDLILVDGPPGWIGRMGFFYNLNIFNTNIPIIFDDINRKNEYILATNVAETLQTSLEKFIFGDRTVGILNNQKKY